MNANLPESFPCPHCQAVYPFKAVLIGRVVRCRSCHQAFQVRADGTAEKAADGTHAEAAVPIHEDTAAKPEAVTSGPPEHPPSEHASDIAPPAVDKKGTRRHHPQLTSQQEEMRHQMSAALADAAQRAAHAAATHGAEPGAETAEKGAAPATRRQARAAESAERPTLERRLVEAVFTQAGAREQREERRVAMMIAGSVVACVLVVALWWEWPRPERDTLRAFAQPPADGLVVLRDFPDTVGNRGWVVCDQLALVDVGTVSFASSRTVPVAGWIDALAALKGLAFDPARQIWTPPGRAKDIVRIWQSKAARAVNLAAVEARMTPVVDQDAVVADLQRRGLSPGDAVLVGRLIAGTVAGTVAGGSTRTPMAGELLADPPVALVLGAFHGHGQCVRLGRGVELAPVDYIGTLLRFSGGRWPAQWKVLDVHAE